MASDMLEDHLNEIGGATPRGQSVTVGGCDTRAAQWDPSAWLNDLFSYHTPRHDQLPKYQAIRSAAKHFAEIVLHSTPPGADQMDAIRKIREAMMMANAAIALDGRG